MRPGQLRIRLMSLLESGIRVSFATRLFDLSHGFRAASADPVLFLRPERRDNGERTFRLLEGERLPTGYGPRTLPAGLRHGAESCQGRTGEALAREGNVDPDTQRWPAGFQASDQRLLHQRSRYWDTPVRNRQESAGLGGVHGRRAERSWHRGGGTVQALDGRMDRADLPRRHPAASLSKRSVC